MCAASSSTARTLTGPLPLLPLDCLAAAQRSAGDQKCIYCPTGSVAVKVVNDVEVVGQQGSTSCNPW